VAVAQAFEQVAAGVLLAAGAAGDLGQAEQHAVPEGVDQRRGGLVRHCRQALGAGGIGGVDEPLQGLGDLDRPVRVRVGLGGVGQVAQEVTGAELVDQAGEGVVVLVPVVHHHGPGQVRQHERGERLQGPVAEEVIGEQVRAGDQQVALAGLRAGADPDRGLAGADHVGEDDQGADGPVRLRDGRRGAGDHAVHEPGRRLRAGQGPDQLRAHRCTGMACAAIR